MGFPRQKYWSELPFPSPGDLPHPEIEPMSSGLAGRFFFFFFFYFPKRILSMAFLFPFQKNQLELNEVNDLKLLLSS